MRPLKYIKYISYIRLFSCPQSLVPQGFQKSLAHRYPPISTPLPPFFALFMLIILYAFAHQTVCFLLFFPPVSCLFSGNKRERAIKLPLPLFYSVSVFFLAGVLFLVFFACSSLSAFLSSLAVWSG